MRSLFKKLLAIVTHVQALSVFLAFAIMVFLSYNFMSDIERGNLLNDVNNVIANMQAHIEADLTEPQIALGVISDSIRAMIIGGADFSEVREHLASAAHYVLYDENLNSGITDFYGFFDCFGEFWSGNPLTDSNRLSGLPLIIDGNSHAEPYLNMQSGNYFITFPRVITDGKGGRLGIICLDIQFDGIAQYAVNTSVTKNSYGILLDSNFNVIAHPVPAYIGRHLSQMNDGVNIQNDLLAGKEISERKAADYNGNTSVLFVRKLNNGWYMALIAYSKEYYKSVNDIAYILILLGAILASALCAILLSIVSAKKKAEERTQIMLDATPLCMILWDKYFIPIDCNEESLKLFDISGKKEYCKRFFELSPEYQPDGRLSFEKNIECLKKAFYTGYCRFEWLYRKLNGEDILCEVTLVRVSFRKEYIVAQYARDLRDMKSVMAKMREADEYTQVLFDTTPLSSFMVDNKNKILACNQETVRLLGLSNKNEFINGVFEFLPEYQPDGELSSAKIIRYSDEAFEEGRSSFECIHQNKKKEAIPTEVTLVRVKFRGDYALAGFIRDLREVKAMITEMRRAEIAEENNRAKSDFLARMSHEIRTPMNAILGITEIQLQDNSLPQNAKEALYRIYNSGDMLLGIINDILDLSKIEAGKLELTNSQYDVASLIHDTVQLNILRFESKPIEFKLIVSETVPSVLIGDELRIKQILNNLLSNAFKYTDEGMINMSVHIEPQERSENTDVTLIFRISDTGQGMTEEQVNKLGEKFARFNLDINRTTEGTGLGMNITRTLIHMMNGDISVESIPGMGSTFTVSLPQGDAGFEAIGKEWANNLEQLNLGKISKSRNAQITREFMPYGSVLVVDDVETNLYVARGLLSPYGISIDTALSGFEAIDKIRDGKIYDVIFMDHMMPRMDGIESVRIIRSLGYANPIIALTANALAGQAEIFLKNGFDGFISKPIDIRQMNSVLNRMIRDKQTTDVIEAARQQKITSHDTNKDTPVNPQLAEIFVRDAEKALALIDSIYQNKCRRTDDFSMLVINVHAMKSALANIGEQQLSDEALKLEMAGREKNIDLILAEIPVFLNSLQNVINKNKKKSESEDIESVDENSKEYKNLLREKLIIIQAACARYDKKLAKETLAELKQVSWSPAIKERLNIIAEHLLHSDFEEASITAQDLFPY
ncbi:MAG: ATP-binding protein [Treponema sp.]|nr:ATP-binding protein [Treponema sp.]